MAGLVGAWVESTPTAEDPRQLAALLSDSDPGAAEFVDANRAVLRPLFDAAGWSAFESLVQGYGFADAQAQLDHAVEISAESLT